MLILEPPLKDLLNLLLRSGCQSIYLEYFTNYIVKHRVRTKGKHRFSAVELKLGCRSFALLMLRDCHGVENDANLILLKFVVKVQP